MTASFSTKDVIGATGGITAAGTIDDGAAIPPLSDARRLQLWLEFGLIYIGLPLLMRIAVFDYRVPLFYALPPVLAGFVAFLYFDKSYSLKQELARWPDRATLLSIFLIFAIGSLIVAGLVAAIMPDRLFSLAAERPGLWLKIMVLYPFTSVLAQEFAYRVFFFHRYGALFNSRWTLILANALAFGFGHILFRNWIAVGGTFVVGLLLAWRYERTRSFWAVYIEHVLWGWLVFTIGLGVYFFTGVKNPAW
ncbi:CPBP family intramembrane glutamic endopeptidase [Hyphomicrobium sp. MC8b]|uniref:CPBP family intramembrane glutamic endopeptidase n=1 Tax=Hyphomicrobium sp. MC8b TaxID=300273 RepID=UPI00391D634D